MVPAKVKWAVVLADALSLIHPDDQVTGGAVFNLLDRRNDHVRLIDGDKRKGLSERPGMGGGRKAING